MGLGEMGKRDRWGRKRKPRRNEMREGCVCDVLYERINKRKRKNNKI